MPLPSPDRLGIVWPDVHDLAPHAPPSREQINAYGQRLAQANRHLTPWSRILMTGEKKTAWKEVRLARDNLRTMLGHALEPTYPTWFKELRITHRTTRDRRLLFQAEWTAWPGESHPRPDHVQELLAPLLPPDEGRTTGMSLPLIAFRQTFGAIDGLTMRCSTPDPTLVVEREQRILNEVVRCRDTEPSPRVTIRSRL